MRNLPPDIMRLVNDGIPRGQSLIHQDVDRAVRQVMLSAIRADWTFNDVAVVLTNPANGLAHQIATGPGRRARTPTQVTRWLLKRWEQTERFAATNQPWTRDDALGFIA